MKLLRGCENLAQVHMIDHERRLRVLSDIAAAVAARYSMGSHRPPPQMGGWTYHCSSIDVVCLFTGRELARGSGYEDPIGESLFGPHQFHVEGL
jgi:hypothetical protein